MNRPVEVDYTNTCSICNENYNKSNHKKVICYCQTQLCSSCVKQTILSNNEIPHCFHCNVEWNKEFLINSTSKSWVNNEYKKHHENVLFEREQSMIQSTIQEIETRKVIDEKKEQIKKISEDMFQKKQHIIKLMKMQKDLRSEVSTLSHNKHIIEREISSIKEKGTERREFIRKCPNGDCVGFLSTSHKCGICNIWCCPDCREIKGTTKDAEHVCDKDILESVKLMATDSKPCPRCCSMIYKTEGCNVMWCVSCNIAFDWMTLKIINSNIHNPHYFEWLRVNGGNQANGEAPENAPRNPRDILCGRELDRHFFRALRDKTASVEAVLENYLEFSVQDRINLKTRLNHIIDMTLEIERMYINDRFNNDNLQTLNMEERVQYVEKKMDELTFKRIIYKRDKAIEKKRNYCELLRMYKSCITDIFYRILNMDDSAFFKNIVDCIAEMNELRKYTNNEFVKISNMYNCVRYQINNDFKLIA